ncbi:MFS transporter [Cohaesibacter gelatinilyticus]|mgnify:CR=1 FL=1|uniref:Predicted arabinose efflux permease, MFS family n=1 Tax=Cohaesibacter gelatinilyticus TaxID=372072 RepID=A0A285NAB7_9HYPH|nr:MFS transporter [Cohaesibacter gelatinilyticus]SNZ06380.1 Predicted arabinose efflux permease, MFS family [Cohaesibacter gelatinilyticus]HAT86346.1 MFS transporter [Hyphomicrobiales bacterium]
MSAFSPKSRLPYGLIIFFGCVLATIPFGPRATMGFFLTPITVENGWNREIFSLAIALQNLVWGIAQPFAGMIADRFGTARVLVSGALIYFVALYWMSTVTDPTVFTLSAGLLMGVGIAGCAFFLILAAFTRLLPPSLRSVAFGLGTAAGSLGQFLYSPISQYLIADYGWRTALIILAASVLIVPLLAPIFRGKPESVTSADGAKDQSLIEAMTEAFTHRSYILLVFGFFVCGWHVAFITTHLPPFISDMGIDAKWGGWAIALIGLFNMAGSFVAGIMGNKMALRTMLSFIYLARAVIIAIFLMVPISVASILVFSAAMGLLWLSTVPPTQGLITKMFGTRYVATLFGFVFLSHQIGAFLGVWLGGILYDQTGSYDIIWWLSIALGIFAALVHWPIKEEPVERLQAQHAR